MNFCRTSSVAVICLLPFAIGHWSLAVEVASPLSPADAQKAFQLADSSLRIELAAAEPEVIDPVAIRFDEDGRMWVVQMTDYPLGNPTGGEPLSKIRVLEDRDGDGRFETATTFADKLLFATGLQPWKGGVFVTLSGRLAYMKDTDGDGRVDIDETWFEGFAEQNSQLRANHPRLGLDNWIYVANGLRGGKVVNRKLPDQEPINISGMDFRFDPLTGKAEPISGNGQFGLCFDDWGNRFTCSNRNPVRHVVIEDRYLKANPSVTVPATVNDVAAWGEQSRIFPISRAWTTSNLHAGQFTAACGVYIYRGDLLPAEFKGNVFTCDPTGNLIHREIMQPAGPTFTSKPAYEGKEFLASPDEWFRPVNMEFGPDGALYVVDMYRCVIEHPDFVPDELKRRPDLRLGDDRGRIWRIVPTSLPLPLGEGRGEGLQSRRRPSLSKTASEDLVPLLEHPNAWQRETAQRLLLQRNQNDIAPELRRFARQAKVPLGRSHAYWAMAGLRTIDTEDEVAFLYDADAGVRRQGILIKEARLPIFFDAQDLRLARPRVIDANAIVRFQARLTLSLRAQFKDRIGRDREIELIWGDVADPWLRRSGQFYLGVEGARDKIVGAAENFARWQDRNLAPGVIEFFEELSEQVAATAPESVLRAAALALVKPSEPDLGLAILRGLLKVLSRRAIPDSLVLSDVAQENLVQIANNSQIAPARRATAIGALVLSREPAKSLLPFSTRDRETALQIAAIVALARLPDNTHWNAFIDAFVSAAPPIRRAIIDGMLANSDRTKMLLDAIDAGRLKANEIDALQVKRLIESRDATIKERAAKLFAAATPADRAKALADYQPVLQMKGDAAKGQAIFEKNCAVCHRIAGIGVNVAPDISDSRTKKLEQLLADILQPNRAIDNNYLGYTVRQLDGTVLTGILTAETATSITLRQQGGKDAVIPRSEIDELKSSGQSLMPEGLERNIPPEDMADLLSFIKNWRYLDGRTPLSESSR